MTPLLEDTGALPIEPIRPSARRGETGDRPARWRVVSVLAGLAAVGMAVGALWFVPAVRQMLRESFTRLPTTYTELYFSQAPTAGHGKVAVPVSLVEHGDHAVPLRLQVWLTAPSGTVTAKATVTLAPSLDAPAGTVVHLPLHALPPHSHVVVHVALLGHTQALHYRL
jgi:hypothetical protein